MFRISPEDFEVLRFEGSQNIPSSSTATVDSNTEITNTGADDATIGTKAWSNPTNIQTIESYANARVGDDIP